VKDSQFDSRREIIFHILRFFNYNKIIMPKSMIRAINILDCYLEKIPRIIFEK